ncbi:hypothetical protein LZZ85_27895 [Terrimonas sp. NA20]|uniref:HEAT repeat domain-containing protein n=1 Tax=Terrimonas ginsenosidimutans TaxID=2908004 RepID=A0ABS9L0R9_9BACT|nr:hypothetical protein [Terrimonas ginsenosidimutans]MCG2618155.1 hypothetical protein [Terrimonas ginsenosidimutans]
MKAIDFMNQLQKNPEYIEMQKQKEREMQLKLAEIKNIEASFINDLQANGFDIQASGDLLKLKKVDAKLAELLLMWLPKISDKHNSQQMLVRALAIAEKPFNGKILMQLFDSEESSDGLKWAIGNTIASASVLNIEGWLEAKLNASQQGKQNEMLIYAAAKYFDYVKAESLFKKLFDIYPLQVADVFSKVGNGEDLKFLQLKSKNYSGEVHKQIVKYIAQLKKRLGNQGNVALAKS